MSRLYRVPVVDTIQWGSNPIPKAMSNPLDNDFNRDKTFVALFYTNIAGITCSRSNGWNWQFHGPCRPAY